MLASRFLPAGEQIAPPLRDEPPWELPAERGLRAEDVDEVRLPVALRGYRFAETDLLLDRLAAELRVRDEEIERLRGGGATASTPLEPAAAKKATANKATAKKATANKAAEPAVGPVASEPAAADDDDA